MVLLFLLLLAHSNFCSIMFYTFMKSIYKNDAIVFKCFLWFFQDLRWTP